MIWCILFLCLDCLIPFSRTLSALPLGETATRQIGLERLSLEFKIFNHQFLWLLSLRRVRSGSVDEPRLSTEEGFKRGVVEGGVDVVRGVQQDKVSASFENLE